MKIRTIIVLLFFCTPMFADYDKMEEAILNIDPEALHQLIIPGFIMRSEDKKRYVALAREVTNKTYKELNDFSVGDIFRLITCGIKTGLGALAATGLYLYHNDKIDISQWTIKNDGTREVASPELTDEKQKYAAYGILGVLSLYFLYGGAREFSGILNTESRMNSHRDALINEAVLQRLPVCEAGTSESILL